MAKKTIKKLVEIDEEIVADDSREFVAIVSGMGMKRRADGRIDTVDYREAFVLTDISAPLSHIVSFYLKPRLIKKYGRDVTGLYTHVLEAVFPKDDPTDITGLPVAVMSFEQLAKYCHSRGLQGFDKGCFTHITEARETVDAAAESPVQYMKLLAFYRERTIKLNAHQVVIDAEDETDTILAEYDGAKKPAKAKAQQQQQQAKAAPEPTTI